MMKKTGLKDTRLQKYVGKTMVVIQKDHPFYHYVGVGREFEELDTGLGFGLIIDYENGESGFVYSASEVQLLHEEKGEETVEDIIERLSGCNYGPKQIAKYLELDEKDFLKSWNDLQSKVRYHYDRGRLQADFLINDKLADNAKSGNITAAQIFFKNAEARRAEDIKKRVIYGDEA
jgi:hypothetical protein